MYTQCPQCLTIYEIEEDALQASLGIVRCGNCLERFDALRTLSDTLPAEPGTTLSEQLPEAMTPILTEAIPPDVLKAAIERQHKQSVPGTTPNTPVSTTPAASRPDDAWFEPLSGERARALIADAAGIPADALMGDPAWQVTELPVQTRFTELDIVPAGSGQATPTDPDLAPPANPEPPAETVEPEAADEPWSVDVPVSEPAARQMPAGESPPEDSTPADSGEDSWNTAPVGDGGLMPATVEPVPPAAEPGPQASAEDTAWPGDEFAGELPFPDETGIPAQPEPVEPPDTVPAGTADTDTPVPASGAAGHVYVPPRRRRLRHGAWLWALGSLILAMVLAAQLAWAQRVNLVRDPATQAWALRACTKLDCRLPPIRDVAKLELLSRDIRPDPDTAGALTITATLRNNAPFRQPWPVVVVELTDLDNDPVAMRRFRAAEYMPDPARRAAGIAPGATAAVAFEVVDPGKRAVSFHFGFQ